LRATSDAQNNRDAEKLKSSMNVKRGGSSRLFSFLRADESGTS
jgi:hypothetical protein